jgi:hypothetical protein
MMPLLDFSEDSEEIKIYVNGKKIEPDVKPVIIDNRTLVPVRAIFEAIGVNVTWDSETKTVLSSKDDTIVTMQIGSKNIFLNENVKEIDVPAQIINDRTFVPVRAVSESYGLAVSWDMDTKTVTITE